jgi:hypothetical protein
MAVIVVLLLAIALVSPPNNVDSQLYHMSRVVHWAQNRSLEHYPTAYEHQLLKPIWAETAILNLRVLWGDDTPANLVQWFSMLISMAGASAIAGLLGVKRNGQWLTAAFVLSIPMGILQSTSTQNDYAVAMWVICLGYFVVLGKRRQLSWVENLGLATSFGLGVLTKGTFFVYGPLLLVWYFLPRLFHRGWWRAIVEGMVVVSLTLLLNLGFWARNVSTYGGPYGTSEWLERNLWFLPMLFPSSPAEASGPLDPGREARVDGVIAETTHSGSDVPESDNRSSLEPGLLDGMASLLSRVMVGLAQNAAQNIVTPVPPLNDLAFRILDASPDLYGRPLIEFLKAIPWNHEDVAGSPLHLLLIPASLAVLVVMWRRSPQGPVIRYALVALATFLALPIVIGHAVVPYGVRYQLPFFVFGAPAAGAALAALPGRRLPAMAAAFLLVTGLPYLLFNNTRPVIGLRPWQTRADSVFTASRAELLFAMAPETRDEYGAATQTIQNLGCREVGLRIDSDDREYLVWWLLDAPQSGTQIQTILTYPHLERYRDAAFRPCAIFCTVCGDREQVHGLPRLEGLENPAVFAGPGYVPDEGE